MTTAILTIGLLFAASCADERYSPYHETERPIYAVLLENLRAESVSDKPLAIYPRFLRVDPEGGPAPGHEPGHYLGDRSRVLETVVDSLPGFVLCSDDKTGRCPESIDGEHITLSAIQVDGLERATVWVMISDLTPGAGSVLYKLAKLERRDGFWKVHTYELISTADMH